MTTPDPSHDLFEAALNYARRGWPVLPLHTPTETGCSCRKEDCSSIGKHPRTKNGLKDATTDEATIKHWWRMWPDANVGIRTGAETQIVVLDVDGEAGRRSIKGRPMPPTPTSRTGNGEHWVFAHPGGTVRNFTKQLPGLDLRGDGGYFIAPPSRHANGAIYEWLIRPEDESPAECPVWIRELLATAPAHSTSAPPISDRIPAGERNSTLTSLAGSMRRRGMTEAEIYAALASVNENRCHPPLSDDEVAQIAQSIARYEPEDTGQPYQIREGGLVRVKRKQTQDGEWVEIVDKVSNFTAEITHDRALYTAPDELERTFTISGSCDGQEFSTEVSARQFVEARSLQQDLVNAGGASLVIEPSMLRYLPVAIQTVSTQTKNNTSWGFTGWHKGEYLFPGLSDNVNLDAEGLNRYQLDPNGELGAGWQVVRDGLLEAFDHVITYPTLAHAFLAPLHRFIAPITAQKYALQLTGETGSLKTTYACAVLSLYGDFADGIPPQTWQSTVNRIEVTGDRLRDCLYLIDDYKGRTTKLHHVVRLIQNYADCTGRGRLNPDATEKRTYIIGGLILMTGEDLPHGEASTMARMLVLRLPPREGENPTLAYAQKNVHHLPPLMANYVQWLAEHGKQLVDRARFIKWRERFAAAAGDTSNPLRIGQNLAQNRLGWEALNRYLVAVGLSDQAEAAYRMKEHEIILYELAEKMGQRVRQERASTLFLDVLNTLLDSDKIRIAPIGSDLKGSPIGNGDELVGWYNQDGIYLSAHAYYAVEEYLRRVGETLAFSRQEIYEQLISDEKIVKTGSNQSTVQKKINGRNRRVLWLQSNIFEKEDDTENPPG